MVHWLKMVSLIRWRICDSLVEDGGAHWLEIMWLVGWRWCGSLVGDGVGSLVGSGLAHWSSISLCVGLVTRLHCFLRANL